MTTMQRGLSVPRPAVVAAATRDIVAQCVAVVASVGRPAPVADPGERRALVRDHAWIEAAANAVRGVRA